MVKGLKRQQGARPVKVQRGLAPHQLRKANPRTGLALETDALQELVRALMQRVGEDPMQFGTHSLRMGGATALYAAGATPMAIRTMGRWSSDLYSLYVRASFEQAVAWSKRAGSTTVHDLAGVKDYDEVDDY